MATIYPPILNSSQVAFIYNVDSYPIQFSLPSMITIDDIEHIQIRVAKQSDNQSIVNTATYPDGIIYKDKINAYSTDDTRKNYSISIITSDLAKTWEQGVLYKIQLRFGYNQLYISLTDFANWKRESIANSKFSEWSTVMVTKAIDAPTIAIKNADRVSNSSSSISTTKSESTLTPLFYGSYKITSESKEYVDKYKFDLYKDGELIETSDWQQHDTGTTLVYDPDFYSEYNDTELTDKIQSYDTHRFKTVLDNMEEYSVNYTIQTINGYEASPLNTYDFLVVQNYLSKLDDVELLVESDSNYCQENACIQISLNSGSPVSGNYVLTRSSEKSDYSIWEDLSYFLFFDQTFENDLIFTDFTIESGIKYQYAFQQENSEGLRTSPLYEFPTAYHSVDFQSNYLFCNGVQLKLDYNFQISSFKHTVLASKQDTLGSKYATILRNGNAYYAEFPISGLISFHMDEDETFFTLGKDGYYYNKELVIPESKYLNGDINTFDTNLSNNNFYIEKMFRDKVEEFLNDGGYKLYRSATEGNIVVTLMNVSLKPNASLGRMLFEFSATAYEVLEFNLDNLNEYGIITIGSFQEFTEEDTSQLIGQIRGLYTGQYTNTYDSDGNKTVVENIPDNLWTTIRKENEYSIGGGYRYDFRGLKCIWVEQYPKLDYKYEILALKKQISDAKTAGEKTDDLQTQLDYYNNLVAAIEKEPTYPIITLIINGKEVTLGKNKIFNFRDIEEDIQSIYLKYTGPVLINYVCEVSRTEDESQGIVRSIESTKLWGQISGIFTTTPKVLNKYNYKYADFDYKVENLVDVGTNFDVYNKLNILDIIKEEARKQVEESKNTTFTEYNEDTKQWNDGELYYTFSDLISVEIEADENTILQIKRIDSDTPKDIVIGPSNKYVLNPADDLISYLVFKTPSYAIINYRCITSQMETKSSGG